MTNGTQILVVKPKTLSPSDKGLLRKNGIVVVEAAEPDDVRLLSAEVPPVDGSAMLLAAMKALAHIGDGMNRGTEQRTIFTKLMAEYLDHGKDPVHG